MIDIKILKDLVYYNHRTGELHWKPRDIKYFKSKRSYSLWNTRYSGEIAGSLNSSGYFRISIFDIRYQSHNVAWTIYYGNWPKGQIDHINGNKKDNRISNLRDVCKAENMRNLPKPKSNTTGYIGVSYHKASSKWRATIGLGGKQVHLGLFDEIDEAINARKQAEQEFGFHENHGRNKLNSK